MFFYSRAHWGKKLPLYKAAKTIEWSVLKSKLIDMEGFNKFLCPVCNGGQARENQHRVQQVARRMLKALRQEDKNLEDSEDFPYRVLCQECEAAEPAWNEEEEENSDFVPLTWEETVELFNYWEKAELALLPKEEKEFTAVENTTVEEQEFSDNKQEQKRPRRDDTANSDGTAILPGSSSQQKEE